MPSMLASKCGVERTTLRIRHIVQVIRPFMLRRTKLEVEKELPSKTAVVIKCGQSAWQSFIYSQISDQVGRSPTSTC